MIHTLLTKKKKKKKKNKDPCPWHRHVSSYSGLRMSQHLLRGTDLFPWVKVKITTLILPHPGVLLHNCRYFNHTSAANASISSLFRFGSSVS